MLLRKADIYLPRATVMRAFTCERVGIRSNASRLSDLGKVVIKIGRLFGHEDYAPRSMMCCSRDNNDITYILSLWSQN